MSLNTLFDQINKMEKTDFGTQVFSDYDDKFPYFAGFALLLLVLDLLLLSRSNFYVCILLFLPHNRKYYNNCNMT